MAFPKSGDVLEELKPQNRTNYTMFLWNQYEPRSDFDEWYSRYMYNWDRQPIRGFKPSLAAQLGSEDTEEKSPHSEDSSSSDEEVK